ncbi:peptidoglycan-binding domain-containing protein [Bartonella bacilliformis]|nr:peptidoglycan-binding domain-containing protein [Bartonella bacilliformis]
MTKKRKIRKTKIVERRNIILAFFLLNGRFLFWIAKRLYHYTRVNALLVIGLFFFSVSFGFVLFNALFLQEKIKNDVFIQMKLIPVSVIAKNSILLQEQAIFQADAVSMPIVSNLRQDSSLYSRQNLSENLSKMHKKLAKFGLYDSSLGDSKIHHSVDQIAVLIERSEMEMANNIVMEGVVTQSEEASLKLVIADIMQVQEALRAFGNQEVTVTGIEDQKTMNAVKQFQKIFHLPITGKIDHTVLIKMREVGLLS